MAEYNVLPGTIITASEQNDHRPWLNEKDSQLSPSQWVYIIPLDWTALFCPANKNDILRLFNEPMYL